MNIDPQLLQAAHQGDRKAQYALYRVCFPVLMAVCMRYRRDEQEDGGVVSRRIARGAAGDRDRGDESHGSKHG